MFKNILFNISSKITFVFLLKNNVKKIGREVIKCIIKKLGSSLLIKFFNFIMFQKKITR